MQQMRRCTLALLALILCGCLPDQDKDIADCEAQAARFFPVTKTLDASAPGSRYIIECMAAKGYEFSVVPADCDGQQPLSTQAACYVPDHWLAGFYERMRRYLKSI